MYVCFLTDNHALPHISLCDLTNAGRGSYYYNLHFRGGKGVRGDLLKATQCIHHEATFSPRISCLQIPCSSHSVPLSLSLCWQNEDNSVKKSNYELHWMLTWAWPCAKNFICIILFNPYHNLGWCYYYVPFLVEETEAQRAEVSCPSSPAWQMVEVGFKFRSVSVQSRKS